MTALPAGGQAKRRARTRAALLAAGRDLLAEGRESASIEEITKRAGVGFGSFFNHFPGGKDQLFTAAVIDGIDSYAAWLDDATAGISDPAESVACLFRLTGRVAVAQPHILAPLLARSATLLGADHGLHTRAARDIDRGIRAGQFTSTDPVLLYLSLGGALLGLIQYVSAHPLTDEPTIDAAAAAALRLLGVPPLDAAHLTSRALPPIGDYPGPREIDAV